VANLGLTGRLESHDEPAAHPLVSIIIPARNEARAIGETLRGLLAQDYDHFEVILVDDRSTDDTAAIARSFGDERLIVVDGAEKPAGWLGKPWALHQGNLRARGELLLFVDADIHYAPQTVRAAVAHLQREEIDLLSFLPHFVMHGFWENVAMPMLPMVAMTVLPLWISNRTRVAALAVGGGPGNLVSRNAYDRAGGHEALKDSVIDDVGLARIVRRSGGTTECVRADHLVSVRMYHGAREILDGFTKNIFAVTGRSYVLAAMLMLLTIVTEIVPYVLVFTGDPYAIAALAALTLTRLVVFAALRFRLDSALFAAPLMAAFWLLISARSIWKTGIRRQLEWRGRTYDPR